MGLCQYSSLKKRLAIAIALLGLWVFFSVIQFSEVYKQNRLISSRYEEQDDAENALSPVQKRLIALYMRELSKLIVKWYTITKEESKDPLLNGHEYKFELCPKLCKDSRKDILVVIHSDPENFRNRMLTRKTWCASKYMLETSIACVFMLGKRNNYTLQGEIKEESDLYGDIVQGNFFDSYHNMTYKHVMTLHWITSQCNDVKTIVKVDDDVIINIYKLVNFSISTGHIHNNIYCSVFKFGRPRRIDGKWLTSKDEYPFDFFPDYCAGLAYIMSVDEAIRLSKASENTRFFWIDDVFVTGILALKSGLGQRQFAKSHDSLQSVYVQNESQISKENIMFYHDFKDWNQIWNDIVDKFNFMAHPEI